MSVLIPITKTSSFPIKHNSKASQVKPFLFKTTHGRANLGFILNGYGFISPEEIEQAELPHLDLGFEYKWEFLKNMDGIYSETFKDYRGEVRYKTKEERMSQIIYNLSKFKLIYAQSQKPIPAKELETKKNIEEISKIDLFNSSGHRIYVCQLNHKYYYPLNDYYEFTEIEEYRAELKRRFKFEFKKKFSRSSLNPFESLEFLTSNLMPIKFTADFSKIDSLYGSIHEFTHNNENPKPKTLTSRLIFK